MARRLRQQLPVRAGLRVRIADRLETIEIKPRVRNVLVGGEAAHAFGHEGSRRLRHARDLALEFGERRGRRARALAGNGFRTRPALRRREAGAETAQVGIDRLAVGADRRLERFGRYWQRAGTRNDAEHHGIDHRAGLARDRLQIEEQRFLRIFLHRLQ